MIEMNILTDDDNIKSEAEIDVVSGGGASYYNELPDKPSINDVELVGNKSLSDFGIENYDDTEIREQIETLDTKLIKKADKSEIPKKTSEIENDSKYITSDYHDSTKQDIIDDLEEIRNGAELGATSLQEHQALKTINNQSIIGEGNISTEKKPRIIRTITLEEDVNLVEITEDDDGNPFSLQSVKMYAYILNSDTGIVDKESGNTVALMKIQSRRNQTFFSIVYQTLNFQTGIWFVESNVDEYGFVCGRQAFRSNTKITSESSLGGLGLTMTSVNAHAIDFSVPSPSNYPNDIIGIRISCQDSAIKLKAGTVIKIMGVDK